VRTTTLFLFLTRASKNALLCSRFQPSIFSFHQVAFFAALALASTASAAKNDTKAYLGKMAVLEKVTDKVKAARRLRRRGGGERNAFSTSRVVSSPINHSSGPRTHALLSVSSSQVDGVKSEAFEMAALKLNKTAKMAEKVSTCEFGERNGVRKAVERGLR
jgi:hypothetical protein